MERYSELVGKRVEVEYRAGDLHLSAVGTLVAVKEKSIFLEDHITQGENSKTMRTEIPHVNVIRITEGPRARCCSAPEAAPLIPPHLNCTSSAPRFFSLHCPGAQV